VPVYELPEMTRLSVTALLSLSAFLAACAGGGLGPVVEAPAAKAGDRWVYRAEDGFRVRTVWTETWEVKSVAPNDITVGVSLKGPTVDIDRTETWSSPGIVRVGAVYDAETRRFDPALIRYDYPLSVGQSWRQSIRDLNTPPGPFGPIQRRTRIRGYEPVTTPAGTFDALRISIIMQLDDETFWRWPTQCNYELWYAPDVGAMVRMERRSHYLEKGGLATPPLPDQNSVLELVSFTRGK